VQTPVDPDTGDLREDLLELLAVRERTMPDHDLQRIFPQMIAAAKVNADVAAAYRSFIAERRRPLQAVLKRAAARGDLPAGLDLDVVHDLLVAPLLYRWLVSDGPIDDRVVGTIVDTVLAGLRVTTP
jgi:AcrR family transcriptional regulator